MAASLSLANVFSFLLPSNSPPPPPPKLPPSNISFTSSSTSSRIQKTLNASSSALSSELSSVICPSLANANTLFFKSAYNVQVIVEENEHEERLLNRFRREVMRAGVIQECKRRRYFENTHDKIKRKTREAAKRNRRRRPFQPRVAPPSREELAASKKDEDDDDNWDMPEGALPF